MTKNHAIEYFENEVMPDLRNVYGPYVEDDKPAIREAWNNYTDWLCKKGYITDKQYSKWVGPY